MSHDINRDPEMWDLCSRFGDKALRCWLEILSIADRNEGNVPGELDSISTSISWAIRCRSTKTKEMLLKMVDKGWLNLGQVVTRQQLDSISTSGQHTTRQHIDSISTEFKNQVDEGLKVVNYAKYHKTWEPQKLPDGSLPSEPSEPNLTKPNIKEAQAPLVLPDWIPQKEWEEFKASRKRKRAPLTDQIAIRIIAVVDRLRGAGHDPAEVLTKAVDRNWTSIEFEWVNKPQSKEDGLAALYAKKGRTAEEIYAELQAKKKASRL